MTTNGKVMRPASLRLDRSKALTGSTALGAVVGLSAMMLMPAHGLAQETEQLATVKVVDTAIEANPNAEPGVPYKAALSGDERRTRPLAETPATITVLTKAQIDDSGYTDLTRILDAQPGITLGTGENGNAFGDRYIIRGQEARSDAFVDGLRDPGMTIRESFAIEQLEITKGPNSSFAGRGTSGGAINAITKQATTFLDFTNLQGAVGTDDHRRVTLDTNKAFSDSLAVRLNLLSAREDVPARSPANRKREGAAVSVYYTPTDDFEATVDYYGLRAKDLPDLGGYLNTTTLQPVGNVPVYAQREDFLKSDVNTFTARLKYRFNDNVRLTSLTRYGKSENGYVVTGSGLQNTSPNGPGGAYVSGRLSDHQGWQDVSYLASQNNLFITREIAGRKNELILGVEYSDQQVKNGVFTLARTGAFNCATGTSSTLNAYCTIAANGSAAPNLNNLLNRTITKARWDQDWQVKTTALSIMDTVDLTDKLTVFAGLRYDKYDLTLDLQDVNLVVTPYKTDGSIWNGHLGVTYKVAPDVVVYGTYSQSADINCGESDVGTSSGYGGCIVLSGVVSGAKPERSENFEVGAKWNLFDQKLLLTAAAFQINKSDVHEGNGYTATGTFNSAKNRVRGFEFGASGAVTDKLTVQAGVTLMDAKITKSYNPAIVGLTLSNFAKQSGVIQAKYDWNDKLYFGGAVKYEGKKFGGQPDTAPSNSAGSYTRPVPAYTVGDLFASYRFNTSLEARLNISNVTDEDYYLTVYQGGSFMYKGDGRATRFTLNYDF